MMRTFRCCLIILCAAVGMVRGDVPTQVALQTNFGDIVLELYPVQAPITVENFLNYANSHFYDGLIFHRVIEGFMIQGGGYGTDLYHRPTNPPIINESNNGLSNLRGTIAMARMTEPDTATCEFFINHVDNPGLDYQSPSQPGYCVFGRVISGMNVVDSIASIETISYQGFPNLPSQLVIINRARLCVYVTPTGNDTTGTGAVDKPFRTIQKAINTVSEPTSIMVAPGTYYEKINFNGNNVAVTSLDPANASIVAGTSIDAGHSGRAVTFVGTETSVAELSGLTVRNGNATTGGGIYGGSAGTQATIHDNLITGNSAANGGAIANCNGAVYDNVIKDNSATEAGGGLYECAGEIYDNGFSGNTAANGGAMANCGGLITNNIAAHNTASGMGGALYSCSGSIHNNTIYANSAGQGGGLADCAQAAIVNCIIWSNSATIEGMQIFDSAEPYSSPTYCCIENWTGGLGNISRDPLFADAANRDFHLKSQGYRYDPEAEEWKQDAVTSPCIDTGSPGSTHENEFVGPGTENTRINMGAYGNRGEASIALVGWGLSSDINNDGIGDTGDIMQMAGQWLNAGQHIASDINKDLQVDFVDFAICGRERFETAGWCWSAADVNGDGSVTFVDFARAAANWGRTGLALEGDFNADGTVDALDMAFFRTCWLK